MPTFSRSFLFFIMIVLSPIASTAENAPMGTEPSKEAPINGVAVTYNTFQHDVGQGKEAFDRIESLFSPSFQKIANGAVLVSKRDELKNQLSTVKEMTGKWKVEVKEIAPLQDPQRCFIRYLLVTEKAGTFDVLATVRIDGEGRIALIDEVYYQKPQ